jgi:hypothetical protein
MGPESVGRKPRRTGNVATYVRVLRAGFEPRSANRCARPYRVSKQMKRLWYGPKGSSQSR